MGRRVEERELHRVEHHPRGAGAEAAVGRGVAVLLVADDRMAERLRMQPHLVEAAGLDVEADERERSRPPQHLVAADSAPAVVPDRLVDHALRGARRAVADGEICLADVAVRLELAAELEVRVLRLGEDNDAGSAAVESVDDARTLLRPDCRGGRAMRDKLVGQRAALVPWRRMHNLPGGLVRHEYRLVLVDDVHRIRKSSKPRGLAFRW